MSYALKKNLFFWIIFNAKIAKQTAAALCLAKDETINPIKNLFLFSFFKPLIANKLP